MHAYKLVSRLYGNLKVGSVFFFFQPKTAVSFLVFQEIYIFFGKIKRKPVLKKTFFAPTKQNR